MTVKFNCGSLVGAFDYEFPLKTITLDWTPEVSVQIVAGENPEDPLQVEIPYVFKQTGYGDRELHLYALNEENEETDLGLICDGVDELEIQETCKKDLPEVPTDTVKIKVVAKACNDSTATAEDEADMPLPLLDLDGAGNLIFDDDPPMCKAEAGAGAPVRLTNGNMRYTERLVLPTSIPVLTDLTFDTLNSDTGLFGKGWFSAFDAKFEVNGGSTDYRYRVITETNHSIYFSDGFWQTWPATGPLGELAVVNVDGTDYYRHTTSTADLRRFYRVSDGRLGRLEVPASETAVTIDYHPSTGMPIVVYDESGAWSWIVDPDASYPDLIGTITSGNTVWRFGHTASRLSDVRVDGALWRDFTYGVNNRLLEVSDGQGHLIETHAYDPGTGRAFTSQTADEHITNIQYEVHSDHLQRPLNSAAQEYATRVTWASGRYTDYYLRPVGKAPYRVVEIRGDCSCPGGGDYTALAYDGLGRVVREQDARGYITVWGYDAQNRVQWVERGHWPDGCDPADFPDDPTMCRLDTDELAATALSPDGMLSATDYTYDATWPNKPATVCTESVVETGQQACDSYTYDPETGAVLSTTRSGYAWDHDLPGSEWQSRATDRFLYDGAEAALFDPASIASDMGVTIVFDSSWAGLPQPQGLVKIIDGPRPPSDVDDSTFFVYYPEDVSVLPAELRGRLAARMDPMGAVTFFDGYDALGNVTRIVDPLGVATSRQHDGLGRVTSSTLEAIPGCDTGPDPLCDTDLVTTYQYLGGAGPLWKMTSPGGGVTEYGYEGWGRVETVSRGPGLAIISLKGKPRAPRQIGMEERIFTTYDPATGNRASESLERWETGAWVERKRTDYRYDSAGRLEETEYPDTPTAAIEAYAYDPQGNVMFFWNPLRYGDPDPNVTYAYDPLGRLSNVWQLEDAALLPSEDAWALTSYSYDSQSNLTAVTDANGNVTTYSVDDFGQTYEIDSPATGVTNLSYNWAGQVVLKEDARGATATHEYDPAGRLDVSVFAGLSIIETIDYGYDAVGRLKGADSGDLNETWWYERRGLTITVARDKEWMGERVAEETEFIYSADGAIETIRYPSGRRATYEHDYAGRPISVSANGPWGGGGFIEYVSDVSYLPFGPPDAVTYPLLGAGTTDNRPHDLRYRLTSQNPGLAEPLRSYTYDLASNLLTADNPTGITDEVYTYDDMGRLATASGAFGGITYDYDSIGNLLTRNATGGPDPGVMDLFYEGGTSPLVERVETTPEGQGLIIHDVVHDAMGNILDDGVSRYFWDPRPIMRFHKQGGTSAYYRYSDYTADGIMMARRAYTVDPVVYYAQMAIGASPSGQRLSERLWDMNFDIVGGREMVWLGDRLIATFDINASDPDYIFTDHIGYPLMVMDSSASTTWSAVHEPYGEAVLTGGTTEDDPLLRYPGQWTDDPAFVVTDPPQRNLFANGYRWYNPDWGRYTQSDPLGVDGILGSDFQLASHHAAIDNSTRSAPYHETGNTYSYGSLNPLFYFDPNGLEPCSMVPTVPITCFEPGSGCCAAYCSDQVRVAVCRLSQTTQASALLDGLGLGAIGFGIGFTVGGLTTAGPAAVPAGCIGFGVGFVGGYCLSDGGEAIGLQGIGDQWRRCMNTCTSGGTCGSGFDLARGFLD